MTEPPSRVPLTEIFRVFFIIGATSFGGGLITWIHLETVTRRKWLTNRSRPRHQMAHLVGSNCHGFTPLR